MKPNVNYRVWGDNHGFLNNDRSMGSLCVITALCFVACEEWGRMCMCRDSDIWELSVFSIEFHSETKIAVKKIRCVNFLKNGIVKWLAQDHSGHRYTQIHNWNLVLYISLSNTSHEFLFPRAWH